MLTKIYKMLINTLVFVLGFILIIIAGVYWWKKIKIEKGFSNADTSDLTDEELQELNDEKYMRIWF